jgi:23S rRNA pseudouridine1911/1915/1917 synthase
VRAGETILLRRPAPVEPDVPRHFGVLYEDASVLVIDKPAGLPMHTTAKFWRNTLVALLRERYPQEQMEIAHRIDRETSGVLLIARSRAVASILTRAFARRAVEKSYLALVSAACPRRRSTAWSGGWRATPCARHAR